MTVMEQGGSLHTRFIILEGEGQYLYYYVYQIGIVKWDKWTKIFSIDLKNLY